MFAQIIQHLPHPAILLSGQGRILATNDLAHVIFGDDILDQGYLSVFRHPDFVAAIERSLNASKSARTHIQIMSVHTTQTFDVTCDPIADGDVSGCVFIQLFDTSDQQQNHQSKRDFVANVSHELKTPLTAMSGFLETLQGPAKNDKNAQTRFLGMMSDETARMARLVDLLLTLSQVERDGRVRPTKIIDLGDVLSSVISRLGSRANALGMKIETDIGTQDLHCLADADQMRQVFINLLENGLKYGRSTKGLLVQARHFQTSPKIKGAGIRLDFTDFGTGFDPIHIARLGERFYRIDEHRARDEGGTGLGLAIVKHILNRHRGVLHIQSKPDHGSTFSVSIPTA